MHELDPQVIAVMKEVGWDREDWHEASIEALRENAALERQLGGDLLPVAQVRELVVPVDGASIRVRLYLHGSGKEPLLVWIHGGGWICGDLDSCEPACRVLAVHSGCAVAAIEYRLAPEHPFPTPLNDCHDALEAIVRQAPQLGLDRSRIAVGGDSAGGNLAAALALLLRDRGGPRLRLQLLAEPALAEPSAEYLGASPPEDPYAAPLRVSSVEGLPPAAIMVGSCDDLRDGAHAYALRLREAGLLIAYEEIPRLAHGVFTYFGRVEAARRAVEAAATHVAEALR